MIVVRPDILLDAVHRLSTFDHFSRFFGFRGALGSPGSDLNCLAYTVGMGALRRRSWYLCALAEFQITVSGY
jgi:hypothetical protein